MPGYQSDHRSARAGRAAEIRRDRKAQWRTVYFLHLEQGERINDYRRTEKRNWQLFLALKALAVYMKGGIPMKKSNTDTCCLTLPLKLEKWQEDRLAKRFEIARQIYNTMVHAELKKLRNIENSQPYRQIQKQIEALNWKNQNDKARLKSLYNDRNKLLNTIGFSEYGFKADIKYYYKHFNDNIGSSVAVHGIAPQVWAAFEKNALSQGR